MKDLFAEIAATSWREWLATLSEFIAMLFIVAGIAVIAVAFAPV